MNGVVVWRIFLVLIGDCFESCLHMCMAEAAGSVKSKLWDISYTPYDFGILVQSQSQLRTWTWTLLNLAVRIGKNEYMRLDWGVAWKKHSVVGQWYLKFS